MLDACVCRAGGHWHVTLLEAVLRGVVAALADVGGTEC